MKCMFPTLLLRSDISWVFGTFMYHCNAAGEGQDPWEKLAPVSLQWGNDPNFSSENYRNGEKLCQTWTNEELLGLSKLRTGRPRAICGQRYPLPCFT